MILKHEFVESAPEELEYGKLYISIPYKTVLHQCICGCRIEVVTPLSPTDWRMTFDGESVSLYPSIGNWSFPCRSHYWIKNSRVIHAESWSDAEVQDARISDRLRKTEYYSSKRESDGSNADRLENSESARGSVRILKKFRKWIGL